MDKADANGIPGKFLHQISQCVPERAENEEFIVRQLLLVADDLEKGRELRVCSSQRACLTHQGIDIFAEFDEHFCQFIAGIRFIQLAQLDPGQMAIRPEQVEQVVEVVVAQLDGCR
jgi:hypothetical protein